MNNLGCIFLWGGGEIALRMLGHRDPIVCYASMAPPNLGAEVLIMRFPIPPPPCAHLNGLKERKLRSRAARLRRCGDAR